MMQKLRSFTLERRMERVNDLYETVVTWEPAGTIRAAVSVALSAS